MNARVTRVDRPITAAGRSVHAVYRLGTAGDYHYGEAVYLDTSEGGVSVAVTLDQRPRRSGWGAAC